MMLFFFFPNLLELLGFGILGPIAGVFLPYYHSPGRPGRCDKGLLTRLRRLYRRMYSVLPVWRLCIRRWAVCLFAERRHERAQLAPCRTWPDFRVLIDGVAA